MIVLAMIGGLAALATPTVRRTSQRAAAAGLGSQIANDLRTARNQAMSRGEAIYAVITPGDGTSANRGRIQLLRTQLRCDDGSAPSGATCTGGFEARRARNCRQQVVLDTANPLLTTEFAGFSGAAQLAGTDPNVGLLCFNPDGRVLDGDGRVIDGGAGTCNGENLVIYTGDIEASSADVTAAAACSATTDDRDLYDVYRVSVPYNGSIMMDQ